MLNVTRGSSVGLHREIRDLFIVSLPGMTVLGVLYAVVAFGEGRFLFEERQNGWGFLDLTALQYDYWGSLVNLHMQPPLLNALVGWTSGDAGITRLIWIYAIAVFVTVGLVGHTLLLTGLPRLWAAFAATAYALLPATVIFAFFPYGTTLIAFFAILAIWGVALLPRQLLVGVAVSAIGMTALFMIRATFIWVVVLGWLIALAVVLLRQRSACGPAGSQVSGHGARRWPAVVVLVACASIVVVVQGHYFVSFQSWTLSTWSSENLGNALLRLGLTEPKKEELAQRDACYAQLVTGAWQPTGAYQACLSEDVDPLSGASVLDEEFKTAPLDTLNYNYGLRRTVEPQWNRFVREALAAEPQAIWRLTTGTPQAPGTVQLFLGRSDDVYTTLSIQKQSAPMLWEILGYWSAVFPYLAWLLVLLGLTFGVLVRHRKPSPVLWWALVLLIIHAVPSILGEYGENARFRAELDPVLVVAAVISVSWVINALRSQRGPGATPAFVTSRS
jgi:hypothetical protein